MSLSLSFAFAGVQVNISPSASSAAKFNVCGVQHFDDGHIEAEVMNFSGKIIISPPSSKVEENFAEKNDVNGITSRDHIVAKSSEEEEPFVGEVVVDAIPEICPPADTPLDCNKNGINEAEQAHSSSSSSSLLNQLFQHVNTSREVVVDATPETQICPQVSACTSETEETSSASVLTDTHINTSSSSSNHNIIKESNLEPYVPPPPNQSLELLAGIDSDDERESNIEIPTPEAAIATGTAVTPTATATTGGGTRVCFDLSNTQIIQESPIHKPKLDLRLHELCASEDDEADVISDLRDLLRSDPELASIRDDFGDFPAHVFANNDSFIYASRDEDVRQFVLELYDACPAAFLTEGYDGQIPFAGAIVDWVDECHRVYSIPTPRSANSFSRGSSSSSSTNVVLLSEIKTLTKSTRVINSLCVREEVQRLVKLPSHVSLPIKAMYSFQMLSRILDELSSSAVRDLRPAQRREFWAVASKRRDKIIQCVARLPFLIRTILLIENKNERDAVLSLSVVRNALFRPESVDLWLVALLSGGERARNCAVTYLKLISQLCLTELFGRKHEWSNADIQRFHSMRKELYDEVAKLAGFLPCMLHLGDGLYDVATRRAVKYVVETRVGRAFPVYMTFMELFLLLTLMTSYRIIVELVYAIPSEEFLSQYREFWGLALTIAVYFGIRDLFILISLFFTEEKLACRYASNFGNLVGYATTASVIPMLSILYVNSNIEGRNYAGIVSGLLWWKVLLHMKGMSESLSTLVYTIIQITGTMKYFLFIFLGTIFFFADMVDIIKKTSGECEDFDGQEDSSLEVFCSLTPLETYLAMYGVMIGGFDVGTLEGSSALVCLLLVAASFAGVIVLVNILIAIVTSAYEKARAESSVWFAKARLEAAVQQDAREKIWNPQDDPNSGIGRKLWRLFAKAKYTSIIFVVEYFLVKSLLSCASLRRDGILGDYLYISLILCAILYNMFVVAFYMYIFVRYICDYPGLRRLRGSKFHVALLHLCLKPVCKYLSSVGLGKGESCPDGSGEEDCPLSRDDFLAKQEDFENSIQEALQASEERILDAVKSMMMVSTIQVPKKL